MCLLIVEILMLIAGLWALITGKLPEKLFKVLFGKGNYQAEPKQARLLGLLLASPLPLAFLSGLILALLFGAEGAQFAGLVEILIIIIVCIAAVIFVSKFKNQPVEKQDDDANIINSIPNSEKEDI